MKTEIVKRMKEVEEKMYIAFDGKEFYTEKDCLEHEAEQTRLKHQQRINEMKIKEFYGAPCDGCENMESWDYEWFKVESEEDMNVLSEYYQMDVMNMSKVKEFPAFVCVENSSCGDAWLVTLDECKNYVEEFFAKGFGIDVTFNANKEE